MRRHRRGRVLEIWNARCLGQAGGRARCRRARDRRGPGRDRRRVTMRLHAARTPTFSHQPAGPNPLSLVTREHDPVLAPELVDLLAPEPRPDRDRLHLRGGRPRAADRRAARPEGTLIGIDRDPTAQERFSRFAAEAPCKALFVGADFRCRTSGAARRRNPPDMVYMDLGMSSMQIDAWERGFSYSYDGAARHAMDPRRASTPPTRQRVAGGADRPGAAPLRRGAPRLRDRQGDRPPPPLRTTSELVGAVQAGCPPRPGSAAATRPSAPSRPCGSPSTASSTYWVRRCRWPGTPCRSAARFAAISFHSLETGR